MKNVSNEGVNSQDISNLTVAEVKELGFHILSSEEYELAKQIMQAGITIFGEGSKATPVKEVS